MGDSANWRRLSKRLVRIWTPYTEPFLLLGIVLFLSFLLLNILLFARVLTTEKDAMKLGEISFGVGILAWPIKLLIVLCIRKNPERDSEDHPKP